MPELTEKLASVSEAAETLRRAETSREEARGHFREALREAHAAGASYALLGRIAGLSRQRVAEIVGG
jgi:hypothetical protein